MRKREKIEKREERERQKERVKEMRRKELERNVELAVASVKSWKSAKIKGEFRRKREPE